MRASAVVALVFALAGWGGGTAASASTSWCGAEQPPAGASDAARAYVAAINASAPDWGALSDRIAQQELVMHLEDLQAQVDADAPFVRAVRAIDYSEQVQPVATAFVLAVMKYDQFLLQNVRRGEFSTSFSEVDAAVNDQRSLRSSQLRDALGLSSGVCAFNRP